MSLAVSFQHTVAWKDSF